MIAFKEWSLVCQALGEGRQSLILRKGGIAEGRAGFQWKHDSFALFPTHFHEQNQHLRGMQSIEMPAVDLANHTISLIATIEFKVVLTDWEKVEALAPFHEWTEETIRDRFDYTGDRAMSVAMLRVSRLREPFTFADARQYGGCRSWVEIPAPFENPVAEFAISDSEHQERISTLLEILGDSFVSQA